jgi:hypothetical protein
MYAPFDAEVIPAHVRSAPSGTAAWMWGVGVSTEGGLCSDRGVAPFASMLFLSIHVACMSFSLSVPQPCAQRRGVFNARVRGAGPDVRRPGDDGGDNVSGLEGRPTPGAAAQQTCRLAVGALALRCTLVAVGVRTIRAVRIDPATTLRDE